MAALICKECDFYGIHGWSRDEHLHRIRHDEHLNGVRLRRLDRFERVETIGSHQVLIVRPDSDIFSRRRAERISRLAVREPVDKGGYDKPTYYAEDVYQIVPEMQCHALVVAHDSRGIALVVVERRVRDAWFSWSNSKQAYELASDEAAGSAWTISHVWVLRVFRRQGLASRILDLAFRGFGLDPGAAGWLTPFTQGGFGLVRRYAPAGFWHAGYKPDGPDAFARPFDGARRVLD